MRIRLQARPVEYLLTSRDWFVVVPLLFFGGCATLANRDHAQATLAETSHAAPLASNSFCSFNSLDADLRDPLADETSAQPVSWTRWQVAYQMTVTETLDDVRGLVHGGRKQAWDEWGAGQLRDGDIVFLRSANNYVLGFIDFAALTRDVTSSEFTHVGVVAIEDGKAYVYDIDTSGPGRSSFGTLMTSSNVDAVAIKRLGRHRQHCVGPAVDYCRRVYDRRMPFDRGLKLGNERLYCSELVELAFRTGGQTLSHPIRWNELPRINEHPISISLIQTANNIDPNDRVIVPGNDDFGLWSCPDLELVLPLTSTGSPPASNASPPQFPRSDIARHAPPP